ncbi:MAG: DHA2 family efflux MFS transporter permease subunit [Kutzneria sp.]|nr:DHA2 family efflux MFS transporter permease subunit [Kutzneria sp.]
MVAAVIALGSIMSILDSTVVNVALQTLTTEFHTSFNVVGWVATGYMLALATVIPVTGWASDRFGTKRLYMLALVMFVAGSALAGLAWNVETLILFRVVQGLGGGMLAPAGMTILTRAAGPRRLGRVMSLLGIPMLIGPIGGPILGGWLIDSVSWRGIFDINIPIGLLALALSAKFLVAEKPVPAGRFDFPGMLMLSPGLALLIYGVSGLPTAGGFTATEVWLPVMLGLALTTGFVLRAVRVPNPLVDLSLFRGRTFSVAMVTNAIFSVSFFGAMLLLPSYFLLVRGESAMWAGLLLIPQGLGALLTMPLTGRLTDKFGARKVVLPGLVLIICALALFTQFGAETPYWKVLAGLSVLGLGAGAAMTPLMSAAMQTLRHEDVAKGSTAANISQQIFGAFGAALMSVVLAAVLAGKFGVPTNRGQLAATAALADPTTHGPAAAMAAGSFSTTFVLAAVLMVVCFVPALFLPRRSPLAESEVAQGR